MRTFARMIASTALAAGIATFLSVAHDGTRPRVSMAAQTAMPAELARGQAMFLEYCAMCHGDDGVGDGELAGELERRADVRPANLTDRGRLTRLGRAGVHRVIVRGGAHTGRSNLMPAWGERLSARQIDEVTNFVMKLPDLPPAISSTTLRAYLTAPPGIPEDGRRLFLHHCAACHGPEGRGDGPFASSLEQRHQIKPRNLTDSTYLAKKSDRELFVTVTLGGGHVGKSTFMPAWAGYLAPEQIKSVVSYVRSISHTAPQP